MTQQENNNLKLTKNEENLMMFPTYQLSDNLKFQSVDEFIEELICRVCLKTSEISVSIFDMTENDENMTYASKINECSTIELVSSFIWNEFKLFNS